MCSLVGACSGLGCPAAAAVGAVLRWPEEAPGVQVGAASLGRQCLLVRITAGSGGSGVPASINSAERTSWMRASAVSTSLWINWFRIQLFGCWLKVLLGSGGLQEEASRGQLAIKFGLSVAF